MDSRIFIKQAQALIGKMNEEVGSGVQVNEETQREINNLFKSLDNPTLPTAYRLRDSALIAGYTVQPQVLNRLAQFENL